MYSVSDHFRNSVVFALGLCTLDIMCPCFRKNTAVLFRPGQCLVFPPHGVRVSGSILSTRTAITLQFPEHKSSYRHGLQKLQCPKLKKSVMFKFKIIRLCELIRGIVYYSLPASLQQILFTISKSIYSNTYQLPLHFNLIQF